MKLSHLALILILGLAAFFRFYGLGAKLPWHDELLSCRLVEYPPLEIIERSGSSATVHPPLYFLLLSGWSALLGHSEWVLRSFSALCGILTVWGGYQLVYTLACDKNPTDPGRARGAGLLTAALLALNPLQIYSARQIRGYTLGLALLVWSCYVLWLALHERQRPRRYWVLYGLLVLAASYTHHLILLSVAAQWLFAALYLGWSWQRSAPAERDRSLLLWPVGVAVMFILCYLPWGPKVLHQAPGQLQQEWREGFTSEEAGRILFVTLTATPETTARNRMKQLLPAGSHMPEPTEEWITSALLGGVLLLTVLVAGWPGRLLFLLSVLPALVLLAYSLTASSRLFFPRYLVFAEVFWLCSTGFLVFRLPGLLERLVLAAILLLNAGYGDYTNWAVLGPQGGPGLRAGMAYILEHRNPDEVVIARTPHLLLQATYFGRGHVQAQLVTLDETLSMHNAWAHLRSKDLVTPEKLLQQRPAGIWMVTYDSPPHQPQYGWSLPEEWQRVDQQRFPQTYPWDPAIVIECYRPPAGANGTVSPNRDPKP